MATIRLQEVTREFSKPPASARDYEKVAYDRALKALDQVTLTIPNGQTMAVLGPSGCGKSTLLRVVAGLDPHYSGHIFYDDQDMADVPPKDRYIGMVFQNYALYPHFEGYGNLAFFFRARKAPNAEAEERIRATSEIMGIGFDHLLRRKPGTLSGGQQQRLAIARAIVRNPKVFLFDEPLSNLDAKLRSQTRVEMKRLLRQFHITSLYVTHDQTEAIALGDRVTVMRAGRVEQTGTFKQLRDAPTNAFVAGFLGTPPMNLLTGGVVQDGNLHLAELTVPLPSAVLGQVEAGQRLSMGIRPEAVQAVTDDRVTDDRVTDDRVTDERPILAGVRLRGVVEVVQPNFAARTQLVYLRSSDQTYAFFASIDTRILLDDVLEVVLPSDALYFFDGDSEVRVT